MAMLEVRTPWPLGTSQPHIWVLEPGSFTLRNEICTKLGAQSCPCSREQQEQGSGQGHLQQDHPKMA